MLRQLVYNVGRLSTYCFLGGLAGALGQVVCTSRGIEVPLLSGPLDIGQRSLAIVAGLLMIAVALQFLGLLSRLHPIVLGFGGDAFAEVLRRLSAAKGPAAPLALGVFNGFLPCPLVYAFAAQAASTAGVVPGILTMAAFGLGTFPAMLMMGGVGRGLAPVWRQRGIWLAGSCILLLGLITIARAVLPLSGHDSGMWHLAGGA
jgi:sulfite exporter TauE/SafE